MPRNVLPLSCAFLCLTLLAPAGGQEVGQGKSVQLHVLLPEEDAQLLIDNRPTSQTGLQRTFISSPFEADGSYVYTLTATWDTNNYTKVIRTRKVTVRAGEEVKVDLRAADDKNPDRFLIRYVPTPENVVEAMCKLAGVGKGDVVYDLGCGDGRIVITAVSQFGAKRGVGVDINGDLVKESKANAKKAGVADRVEFRKHDVLDLKDLGDATVVMLYMGEDVNLRLRPILQKSLKAGARIVSHDFSMGDWKAQKKITITDDAGEDHELYLWTIGAK